MKNFKMRKLTVILTVIAVVLTSCGIGLFALADTPLPAGQGNITVLNPCEDLATLKSDGANDGTTSTKTITKDVSPYGDAVNYLGLGGAGASMWNVAFPNNLDKATWKNQKAFAFWVSVPGDQAIKFSPCVSKQDHLFLGECTSFNTATGEVKTYADNTKFPSLSNFEGFLIFKLDGLCVGGKWDNSNPMTWSDFVDNKTVNKLCFYQNHSNYAGKNFTLDQVVAIADVDKFLEELAKQPKRPMPPTADPGFELLPSGTEVFLKAAEGCQIYYTLNGDTPTEKSILFESIPMGEGIPEGSPIAIREATTVKAIAVANGTSSAVATFKFDVEAPYTGPNVKLINNGTGEGRNTVGSRSSAYFDTTKPFYAKNDSADGMGMPLTTNVSKKVVTNVNFFADLTGVQQPHNAEGYSFHVDVPYLGKDTYNWGFAIRVNGEANSVWADFYAVSDDGKTIKQASGNSIKFNKAFSGTVYVQLYKQNAVKARWGAEVTTWFKYIKKYGLDNIGFYFTRDAIADGEPYVHTFEVDDFALIYDMEKCFEDIGLEGLLATYDAGTFENTNMIVTNDGSGNKKRSGLVDFSDGLVIEKSDYSFDERCLKLTMPGGESFINFAATSTEHNLLIGAGSTFWVEMPKGVGDTTLNYQLFDNNSGNVELWEYAKKWYYLVDKYGVVTKKTGELTIPDGFRGWVVLPKDCMHILEEEGYSIVNAELDYNQLSEIKVTFKNAKSELTGKTVYIDDISVYTSFSDLIKSRGLKWEGQVFE